MTEYIFKGIGAVGLLLISSGIISKKHQVKLFFAGGLCLVTYSIYIQDIIFITLESVYVLASVYKYFKNRAEEK